MRFWFVAALMVAAALRLGFIFTTNTPAIYFDSVAYLGVADDLSRLVRAPGAVAAMISDLDKSRKDRKSLKQTAESHGFKHISHINARLVAYPIFLAMIRLFTDKIVFISITQALLDVGTCCLLFLVASRLFRRNAGLLAMWIYALYPPLVIAPHYVMSETLSGFLLVALLVASHRMLERGRARDGAWAGATLFLLLACRQAFQLLPVVVFPAYALVSFARGDSFKAAARKLLPAAVVLLLLALPWMLTLKAVFGNWLAPGQGGLTLFVGQNQKSRGWQDDNWNAEIPGWVASTPNAFPTQEEYKRAALQGIKERPADFTLLVFEKTARFWSRPQNEFSVDYMVPSRAWGAVHIALMLLGLAGFLAAPAVSPVAAVPVALILSASLTHGLTLALARYNLPFMPLWILFAAWSIATGPGLLARALPLARHKAVLGSACGLLVLYFLNLNLLGLAAPGPVFKISGLAALGGFLWVFLALGLRAAGQGNARPAWRIPVAVFTVAVFASLAGMIYGNPNNLSWAHRLKGADAGVQQVLSPRGVHGDDVQSMSLYIDAQASPSDLSPLEIRFNGKTIKSAGTPVRAKPDFFGYLNGTYEHYRHVEGLQYTDFRQWFSFPVDPALLGAQNRIELLWHGGREEWCRIYGDYYFDSRKRTLFIPQFIYSRGESSIWKYVDEKDNRLMHLARPRSTVTQSARQASNKMNTRDLSSRIGVQRGQYRLRLVLEMKDGTRTVL